MAFAWEQRKVKDVANRYDNLRIPVAANLRKKGSTPYYGANGIQDYVDGYTHNGEFVLVAEDGANDLKNYPVKCVKGKIWVNNHAHVLQTIPEIADNMFLAFSINQADIESLLVGGGRAKLNADVLMGIELMFPSKVEQKKIGEYIHNIDKLITLHQCEFRQILHFIKQISRMRRKQNLARDWEQREFAQLYTKVSEKNDLTYTTEHIISVANMYYKTDSYITDMEYLRTYNVFKLGDIAFEGNKSKDFAHGRFVENTIGNGIVSHVFDVFRPIMPKYSIMFWKYAINNERLMGKVLVRCTKASTMMTNLVAVDFLKEYFLVPTVEEQEKIGIILDKIDNLITLHQCKDFSFLISQRYEFHFENTNQKATTWEQCKFGEAVIIERGGSPRPIDEYITNEPDGLNWVKIGDAPEQGNYITKTAEKIKPSGLSKTREVHPNDLILSNSMSFGKPYIMAIDGCIHDGWLLIRDNQVKFDLQFLCHLLGTSQMLSQYKSMAAGSTVNNLNKELVGNTIVTFPIKREQELVGLIFEKLDNLITLHQRQLERLKNIKAALLEKMFV